MANESMITFPPGELGSGPVRLPILARGASWIAVPKPAEVGVTADPCERDVPLLVDALVAALRAGKQQLSSLGLSYIGRVHTLDAEITGAVVLATDPAAEASLRSALGSRQWEFVYEFVVRDAPAAESLRCDLPIARHKTAPRMVVSATTGRKSSTQFAKVDQMGRFSLWEARTAENRMHQVRLHAAECGLRIPGEKVYGRVPLVYLSAIKANYRPGRDEEKPLHAPIAVHLRRIKLDRGEGEAISVDIPRPRSFSALLKRLSQAGQQ